jgi:hypothetical protein
MDRRKLWAQAQRGVDALKARGFDQTELVKVNGEPRTRVRCSSCAVAIINGLACHETGCPNARHECAGCGALIGRSFRYCDECQS